MSPLAMDDGLLRRFRDAAAAIAWSPPSAGSPRGTSVRVGRLRQEEARVERRQGRSAVTVEVTAGPVGALVLLLEADRRGPPSSLGSRNGRAGTAFPAGSIVASWGGPAPASDARPSLEDLAELARYALL